MPLPGERRVLLSGQARDHRSLAGLGTKRAGLRRPGPARSLVHPELVVVARPRDPCQDAGGGLPKEGGLLILTNRSTSQCLEPEIIASGNQKENPYFFTRGLVRKVGNK